MRKTLIFDFDGTIADSIPQLIETIAEIVPGTTREFLEREESVYLLDSKFWYFIKEFRLRELKLLMMAKAIKKRFAKRIPTLKPFRGISEVLAQLKSAGARLVILSSSSKPAIEEFLKNNSINIFDEVHGDTSIFGKSEEIKKIVRSDEEVYYIGDEIRDIAASRNAGCRTVAVTWGFSTRKEFESAKPDLVFDNPEDLGQLTKNDLFKM